MNLGSFAEKYVKMKPIIIPVMTDIEKSESFFCTCNASKNNIVQFYRETNPS